MKKSKFIMAVSILGISSCASTPPTTPGNYYSWNSVNPPRENILGKEIYNNGSFGQSLFQLTDNDIINNKSLSSLSDNQYNKAKAGIDLLVKDVTANLNYEDVSSEALNSNELVISEINNFTYKLPVEKKFAYQCLTAASYTFEARSKGGFDAKLDGSKLANKFGVDTANITFDNIPDKADTFKVQVNSPSVCLSYVSAYFEDDNDYIIGNLSDKSSTITGVKGAEKYSSSFNLKPGEKSHFRSPQFIGTEPAHKPLYRLMAVLDDNKQVNLSVCKQDRGTGDRKYTCKDLQDDGYGNWDRPYHIDTFGYGNQKYKVVNLAIEAKRLNKNNIEVKWAKLQYPQYKLIIN